jgi:hypothetical protein
MLDERRRGVRTATVRARRVKATARHSNTVKRSALRRWSIRALAKCLFKRPAWCILRLPRHAETMDGTARRLVLNTTA